MLKSHPGTLRAHVMLEGCDALKQFYKKNACSTLFTCCYCNKSFLSNLDVLNHVFKNHKHILILCSLCGINYPLSCIKQHKHSHLIAHTEKPIYCKKCKVPFCPEDMITHLMGLPHGYNLHSLTKPILERNCLSSCIDRLTVACLMYCKENLVKNKARTTNDASFGSMM